MRALSTAALSLVALIIHAGPVAAQGSDAAIDAQTRWPTLSPGDLALVRGDAVLPHLETAVAVDFDVVRHPIVVLDRAVALERAVVSTRLTATALFAVGLFDRAQLTVALPGVWQDGEGRAVLTHLDSDALPAAAAGDLRLDFQYALPPPGCGCGRAWGIGAASGLIIPIGDASSFAGGPGFAGYLDGFGRWANGPLRLQAQVGLRFREPAAFADSRVGSQVLLSGGAAVDVLEDVVTMAAEGQILLGLVEGSPLPALALVELRLRLGAAREGEVALGAGVGLGREMLSPSWELVLALRYIPAAVRANDAGA